MVHSFYYTPPTKQISDSCWHCINFPRITLHTYWFCKKKNPPHFGILFSMSFKRNTAIRILTTVVSWINVEHRESELGNH